MSDTCSETETPPLTRERYETILETIRDGVYMLDESGEITWVNEVFVTEFDTGYTREELLGTHVGRLLSEADRRKCQSLIWDLYRADNQDSARCEIALQTKYGTELPMELHLALLPLDEDEFQGTVGVLRDITGRKQREEWLQVLNRILRHNLRNQLNIIRGRVEVLETQIAGDDQEQIETINEAIESLVQTSEKAVQVQDVLMEAESARDTVDAVEIVTTVCQEFQEHHPSVDCSLDVPADAWVHADRSLAIVVENLLENAVEHAEQATPAIDVAIQPETQGSESWVEIQIADDGPGIPPVEVESVSTGEVTPLRHGSGIGLWLVKWLVERYSGDVSFRERDPQGNIVSIRLRPAGATSRG